MRGKYKSRSLRRKRADAGALNPDLIQNGHPTSNQSPELISFWKTLVPLWPDNKDTASKGNDQPSQFKSVLNNFFKAYTKPLEEYLDFLELIISNDSRSSSGSSFSIQCTKTFNSFLSQNNDPKPVELSNEVKLRAFLISSRSMYYDLKKIIFDIYKFIDSPEVFKIGFPQLKKSGFQIQSSHWIRIFNAEDQFEMREYLFPMLLEKNAEKIFNYLKDNQNKMNDIVKLIDALVEDTRSIQNDFMEFLERTVKRSEVLTVKNNTVKIIKLYIKQFNINPELTPNYNQRNLEDEIIFLINLFYRDEISEEAFEERVILLCEDNPALQDYLIRGLKKRGLYEQAQKFSKIFNKSGEEENRNIPPRVLPPVLLEYYSVDNLFTMTVFVDSDELSRSMLQYIDSLCTKSGSESTIPVGLDLEWRSVCTPISLIPPALFQVAFDKRVYLIDVNKLHSNTNFWLDLNDKLLMNEKFSKLGYGLQNDQGSFKYYSNLGFISLKGLGFIDLHIEEKKYTSSNNPDQKKIQFPYKVSDSYKKSKQHKGLSRLVFCCFGQFLDKREVFSDWNRRPLRKAQTLYAAMDAYCLLQVYEVLAEMHKESGNHFDFTSGSSKKANIIPESRYRRQWGNQFMRKKRFWYKRKKEVGVQVSVECNDFSTQTQSNLTSSIADLTI